MKHDLDKLYNNGKSDYSSNNPYIRAFTKDDCEIPVYLFVASDNSIDRNNHDFNPYFLARKFTSEGEQLIFTFNNWCSEILIDHLQKALPKKYYILLDELDSGLSYDNLLFLMEDFFSIVRHQLLLGMDIKVVVTANSYELLDALQKYFSDDITVYWLPTMKQVSVNSYEDFTKLYLPRFRYYKKKLNQD